ncbi:MAG: hypothetical protein PeribacterA2_0854 [Candidatus Peribacter riflensis]|uniref:Flavodoxin-like domain-containing protein n=1 Tax=Candidatus Peribacter riflensis TaxID=1735162 RepID=A0A0S1SXY1_9BACT|nr:MAG: hypothetical protein PeribacterA2_0854 [Candidatus Peribacter riflensis]OGJ77707.1 MAG: hypothetical protein A2398_04510 [Candidatus Peribacteria bacterium RIFOXYB1_FULL_57_12]OGJ79679.1 MAG: hypothetical protein A2412_01875 [Candidatus Peribacteria bacterium RIFOXYC1_FULL_58_8]ALM11320.1 MAG: hypothetical protein PeribacterB2_0856 [Candidatus Peribacter riflensis]ALM12422.1 MAG: hypothetical protein PeribacterC2_0855 [Candidatus Peribacter riflensis]
MALLHVVYSTSTGHTEHVVDTLLPVLIRKDVTAEKQRAEAASAEDLLKGDVLLLACGTWNTGGSEGQLHPHMHALLTDRARAVDLNKKPCALIALGDSRYYYTARATEHLMKFVREHNGTMCVDPLILIGEPYGQEEKIAAWGQKLLAKVTPKQS